MWIQWYIICLIGCCYCMGASATRLMIELGPAMMSNGKHAHPDGGREASEENLHQGYSVRCISEWFTRDVITAGTYRLVDDLLKGEISASVDVNAKPPRLNQSFTRVIFDVKDRLSNQIHRDLEVSTQARQFVFTPVVSGEHDFCFYHMIAAPEFLKHSDIPYLKKIVELDLKSAHEAFNVESSNRTSLYADLKPIDLEIEKISVTLGEITKEMDSLKENEHDLRELNEQIYNRVKFLGIAFTVALISTSAWQLVYLKRLFRIKKIM